MKTFPKTLAALALALAGSVAAAAPKDDLHAAFAKFLAAKSFRATATDLEKDKPLSTMEFVAPDRYRMDASGSISLIIGDTMYVEMDGAMQPLPVPGVGKIVAQYRNPDFLTEVEHGMAVTRVGDDVVGGEPATVYAYTLTRPAKVDAKTWISAKTGLPIQTESTSRFMGHTARTRVRYSDFNDPSIRIDAP